MIDSRNIDDLKPYLQYLCRKLIDEAKKQGLTLKVIGTLRDQERQTQLHNQAPKANPSLIGPHGSGLAFDIVPLKNGNIDWKDYALFKKMSAIGKSLGLEWGGDWKGVDCPHFQFIGGLTDEQIRVGKLPKFPPLPLEAQFRVYGSKMLGNGLDETYAKTKSKLMKLQGYTDVYYTKPDGTKINQ